MLNNRYNNHSNPNPLILYNHHHHNNNNNNNNNNNITLSHSKFSKHNNLNTILTSYKQVNFNRLIKILFPYHLNKRTKKPSIRIHIHMISKSNNINKSNNKFNNSDYLSKIYIFNRNTMVIPNLKMIGFFIFIYFSHTEK